MNSHYELSGSIRCNPLVESATELLAFKLEIETKGGFNLTCDEAKEVLGNLYVSILDAATSK